MQDNEISKMQNESKNTQNNRSGSQSRSIPTGHGTIEIAGVTLEAQDVKKLNTILEGQNEGEQKTGAPYYEEGTNQKMVLQQSIADAKMTALMGQTLQQKELIIKQL